MSTITASYPNRDIRQRQIVPPQELARSHALVIGVGAIGRQVALQLAGVGVAAMELVDHDTVGEENLAAQGYWPADLGKPKVEATAALCCSINPDIRVQATANRFRRSQAREIAELRAKGLRSAVFCCVDSIQIRSLIWEAIRKHAQFFADGRMNSEVIRVLASDRLAIDSSYCATLFPEAETHTGACTARSTLYTASIAAGLMVGQFTRWLRGIPVDKDISLNLLSMELSVS